MTATHLFSKARPLVSASKFTPATEQQQLAAAIHEGRMTVTAALARRILNTANYSRQRPVRSAHVSYLADEMRRGNFVPGTQVAFAELNGDLILVNGQHRLSAQAEADRAVEYQVLIHQARDMDDVARFYYRQDRGGRSRSDSEVLASVGVAERFGLSKTIARSVFQAAPLIGNRFLRPNLNEDPTLRNDDLRLETCKAWWPMAAVYEGLIEAAPRMVWRKLVSSQALAVALVTIKYQPEKAHAFWSGVATDDGLRRNDPRKALLIDFSNREWGRKSSDGAVVTSLAWNAYFTGRTLQFLKIVNGAAVRIAGTPYTGRGN